MKAIQTIISAWLSVNLTIVMALAMTDRKVIAWAWAIQALFFFPVTILVSSVMYVCSDSVRADTEILATEL